MKKEAIYTDAEILDWLSACSKIDSSGYDSGLAFERLLSADEPIGVADVRIAVRGFEGIDRLRKQASIAMSIDKAIGDNNGARASRRARRK